MVIRHKWGESKLKGTISPQRVLSSLFILSLIFLSLAGCSPTAFSSNQVCFKKQCVNVEIAHKKDDLERGLMFRESLADEAGMLFIFPQSKPHSFWMKNTLIPLDILWLDASRQVVFIARDVPPCNSDPCPTYTPPEESLYVLEVNAGYTLKHGIQAGDKAIFHISL